MIALIGLVGIIAASSAVSDWLRRRDLRESIKGDVEIWAKLPPESRAKAQLLSRIEERVDSLGSDDKRRMLGVISFVVTSIIAVGSTFVVLIVNGGRGFRRDDEGVLRWYAGSGSSHTFQSLVVYVILLIVIGSVASHYGQRLLKWLRSRRND